MTFCVARSSGRVLLRTWFVLPEVLFRRDPSRAPSPRLFGGVRVDRLLGCSAVRARLPIVERLPGLPARELPVDLGPPTVGLAVPGPRFRLQRVQVRYPSLAEALPRVQAEFDLRLIQPASVFGGVVYREPVPKAAALPLAKEVHQRLPAMDIEVVHDE